MNVSGGSPGAPPTYFFPYRDAGEPEPVDELNHHALFFDNTTPPGGTVTDRITAHTYIRTGVRGVEGEYVTDRLTDEALDWMTYNADQPMFLYLSHYGVHGPFEAPTGLVAKYEAKLATMDYGDLPEYTASGVGEQKMRQDFPTYAAMIESVDQSVGRILDRIEELGIASNTVVAFSSDNGGLSNRGGYNSRTLATANHPLRTGKGWLYEGGIREPFIVRWPGVTPTNTVSDAVVNGTDFYPTFLEMTGLSSRTNDHEDGVSFVGALQGLPHDRGEPIFWHSPQARPYSTGDFNSSAVREGDYKLIWFYDTPGQPCELYNVTLDIGENTNLVSVMPAKAQELLDKLQAWHTNANNVVFRPDENDVAKPPQPYLDDPGAPVDIEVGPGQQVDLVWNHWTGYTYRVMMRTNLLAGSWTTNQTGLTTNTITVPTDIDRAYYRFELELEPEI
jgi:arylsulfatase A-like enzyme